MLVSARIIIVLIALAICAAACASATSRQSDGAVQVVLLAGQSNMAGAGGYFELDDETRARIDRVKQRVQLSVSGNSPQPLSYSMSKFHLEKYGFAETFGPEMFIGLTLAEQNPTQEFLLIKTARGGTSLYGAWNPEWSADKAAIENTEEKRRSRLYELHIRHVRDNLAQLDRDNRDYEILGMVWMQGENDAAREVSARSYEENLTALINAYRTDVGEPQMPFVIGQINSTYGKFRAGPSVVRSAMAAVAQSDPFTLLVETSTNRSWADYPKHPDNTHYNTEGQQRLGRAFALALESVFEKEKDQ